MMGYMTYPSTLQPRRTPINLTINDYSFEGVNEFTYLGAYVNSENKVSNEITKRIMTGNTAYFGLVKLLMSSLLTLSLIHI